MGFRDIIDLLFPSLCVGCQKELVDGEKEICLFCQFRIPRTFYISIQDNEAAQLFWGKFPFDASFSYLYFKKNSFVESLIYAIKYRNAVQLAFKLGCFFGIEIQKSLEASKIDFIIPVPIHRKKKSLRGYNQSELIARGLAHVLKKEVLTHILIKTKHSQSVTHSGREERRKLIENSMSLRHPEKIQNKTILLVDDVLTTGITLETCALKLHEAEVSGLYLATLARRV